MLLRESILPESSSRWEWWCVESEWIRAFSGTGQRRNASQGSSFAYASSSNALIGQWWQTSMGSANQKTVRTEGGGKWIWAVNGIPRACFDARSRRFTVDLDLSYLSNGTEYQVNTDMKQRVNYYKHSLFNCIIWY